ncbi:MAG: nitroreductase family protein [Bacteroidales bacterium]|nr:nitroreductase family protein [Bacteroidales bacterium]
MKKLSLITLVIALTFTGMSQDIKLPVPTKKGGMPLYEALANRQTNRDFSPKQLTDQQLSDVLWCAGGVNREESGKLTSPTARNAQEIDIYVFNEKGVYLYLPKDNMLKQVLKEDHRPDLSGRGGKMTLEAPVTLLFFANYDKMNGFDEQARGFYGATDAGFVSQNVYLYCAANHLSTVVMGAINRDRLTEIIPAKGKPILAQPIGYAK